MTLTMNGPRRPYIALMTPKKSDLKGFQSIPKPSGEHEAEAGSMEWMPSR